MEGGAVVVCESAPLGTEPDKIRQSKSDPCQHKDFIFHEQQVDLSFDNTLGCAEWLDENKINFWCIQKQKCEIYNYAKVCALFKLESCLNHHFYSSFRVLLFMILRCHGNRVVKLDITSHTKVFVHIKLILPPCILFTILGLYYWNSEYFNISIHFYCKCLTVNPDFVRKIDDWKLNFVNILDITWLECWVKPSSRHQSSI